MQILIVEDEALIALDLTLMLEEMGHVVVASASTLKQGLKHVEDREFDVAIIDLNLAGESSEPIARRLLGKGVPFIFTTGYASRHIPQDFADRPFLSKPYSSENLERVLATISRTGSD